MTDEFKYLASLGIFRVARLLIGRACYGIKVSGLENLSQISGRSVVVANHVWYADPPILMDVFNRAGRKLFFLSKKRCMKIPLSHSNRTFLRGDFSKLNFDEIVRASVRGYDFAIFPQGGFHEQESANQIGRCSDGYYRIGARLGRVFGKKFSIVPVGINYGESWGIPFMRDDVYVSIGQPIRVEEINGENAGEEMRTRLQALCDCAPRTAVKRVY